MHNLIKSSTGHIIFFLLFLFNICTTAAPALELNKSGDKVYGSVRNNEMNMYYVNADSSFTLSLNYVELVTVYIRARIEPTVTVYDYTIYSAYPSQEILVYTNMTYFIGVSTSSTSLKSYTLELKKSTSSNGGATDSAGLSGGIVALIAIIVAIVVLSSVGLPILIAVLVCCGVCGCGIVSCGIGGATALHANAPTPQPSTSTTTTVTQTTYGVSGQPVQQQQQPMEKPYYPNQPQQPPYNDIPMQPMPIPVLAQQTNPISSMHSLNSWEGSQISLNSGFSSQAQLYENLQPTCPVVEEELDEEPTRRELVLN